MNNDDLPEHASHAGSESLQVMSPDQALALDLALGILVEPLLGRAVDRSAHDEAFGILVAGYRAMLYRADDAASFDVDAGAGITPSGDTWAAVQARIAQTKDS